MILADTSVWVDHLRDGNNRLAALLDKAEVWTHPFVIGELACGNLSNRDELLMLLGNLPRLVVATDAEVLFYIEQHQLMGRGIGYIDTHLLAAVAIAAPVKLWTRDRRLVAVAGELGLRT
jgi:predicted nucleic acid-binding protein